jgi:hypothetical protein
MVGEGILLAIIAGVAGGILGGFIGRSLTPAAAGERAPRWVVPAAAAAVVGLVAFLLPAPVPSHPPTTTVTLRNVQPPPTRTVQATIRLHPANAANGARWFTATAWQGGGSVVDYLKKVGPGVYRTTKPIPVYGWKWKSSIRLQRGREVLGLPIYMPSDPAIPAKQIPAPAHFTRPFERDKKLLQREQKPGIPGFLTLAAYLFVLIVGLVVLGLLAWGLRRIAAEIRVSPPGDEPEPPWIVRAPARERSART